MNRINMPMIMAALGELADEEYQLLLWTGRLEGAMGSFVEAVEDLFDDSGLGRALGSGEVIFDAEIDRLLHRLSAQLDLVVGDDSPGEILAGEQFADARQAAATALFAIARSGVLE